MKIAIKRRWRSDFAVTQTVVDLSWLLILYLFLVPSAIKPELLMLSGNIKIYNLDILIVIITFCLEYKLKASSASFRRLAKVFLQRRKSQIILLLIAHFASLYFNYESMEQIKNGFIKMGVEASVFIILFFIAVIKTPVFLLELKYESSSWAWVNISDICDSGDVSMLKEALHKVGSINAPHNSYGTPLEIASQSRTPYVAVDYMLANGADPTVTVEGKNIFERMSDNMPMVAYIEMQMAAKQEQGELDSLIAAAHTEMLCPKQYLEF